MVRSSVGGKLDHLLEAGLVGLPTLGIVPLYETGLLSAVSALALQGLEDLVKGHDSLTGATVKFPGMPEVIVDGSSQPSPWPWP